MARIAGINIPQNKLVHIGLTYIYGIGDKFSNQICSSLEIPKAKRVNELTDDEIKLMLSNSILHAQSDLDIRSFVEAKTEAEQLIYATQKFTREHTDLLLEANVVIINEYIREIQNAIENKDRDAIIKHTDSLNTYSRQFAEKAMDKNIAKALQGKKIE